MTSQVSFRIGPNQFDAEFIRMKAGPKCTPDSKYCVVKNFGLVRIEVTEAY